jgi:Transmembrane domain of unknown function (DUF3566)
MRSVVTTQELRTRGEASPSTGRRTNVVIRRINAWSVLKFSLLFYFCLMLVFMFALLLLYWVLGVIGVLDSLSKLLSDIGFGSPRTGFEFHGYWIFSRLFLIGVGGVIVWSLVNMLVALLYNLCADVVGGIKVTLGEERR